MRLKLKVANVGSIVCVWLKGLESCREKKRGDEQFLPPKQWRMGDLLADERCSPAVLDFSRWASGPSSGGKLGQRGRGGGSRRRRTERRNAQSSGPRAPGIGFPLFLGALYFLCQILFGERGGEVAATEPDLRGGIG